MKRTVLILLTFITIFLVGCAHVANEESIQSYSKDLAGETIADNEECQEAVEQESTESAEADLTEASQESGEAQKDDNIKDNEEELEMNPGAGEAYGGTLELDPEVLKETIISQIAEMNQYIDDHCGWPEDEYDPGAFIGSNTYIDEIILFAETGEFLFANPGEITMHGDTVEAQLAKLRYSMFNRSQFYLGSHQKYPEYNDILVHWLEQGHFSIETIDTISVEYLEEPLAFDKHHCNIIVTFTSEGETYICWMEGITGSADGAGYKILDIQRQ